MQHFDNGEWDKGIEVGKKLPHNWDFFQQLPSKYALPDDAINKISDHIETKGGNSSSGFYYEMANNLPEDISSDTLRKLADRNKDSYVESEAFTTHPNYRLSDEGKHAKHAADMWSSYEREVHPSHFAAVKSMFSGLPESVNFRGKKGESQFSRIHHGRLYNEESPIDESEADPHSFDISEAIPHLKDHAKKVQQEVLNDKWIPKKIIKGEPHILLHRGVSGDYADKIRKLASYKDDGSVLHRNITAPTLSFSSWSTNPDVASRFAHRAIEGQKQKNGVVIRKWMPVSSILHSGEHSVIPGQDHPHTSESEIIIGHPDEKVSFKSKDLLVQKPEHLYGRTSPVTIRPHPEKLNRSESLEDENKKINESKKTLEAQYNHKFKAAKWTHPNGHPRCAICGCEQPNDVFCEGRLIRMAKLSKSEESDSPKQVDVAMGLGKHRQLRHFLSQEPEQKASKQKLKENGFDVQQLGYNPNLDSKGNLHHKDVHNKIESEPKLNFHTDVGQFDSSNVPEEAKQYYHLKNFKPETYGVDPTDEAAVNSALMEHMNNFDPEKDHSQRHSEESSQVFHLNATPQHIEKMKDAGVLGTFNNMMDVERRSGHPNKGSTVGWVRFTHSNHEDPEKTGYHVDEIQNDLSHSWIDQTVSQINEGLRTKQITPMQAERIHNNAKQNFPDEHLKKINEIMFEGHKPNDVLHEAFLQHLRDKGEAGKQVHVWQAQPKAKISAMDPSEKLPVHMTDTYNKAPPKMGYKPGVYGELDTHSGEHFGEPTWKHTLVKAEGDYQSNAKKGMMISFPAYIKGDHYRPDMPGIHYHTTIRQFNPSHNTTDDVHKQASMIDLKPPHKDTPISFGHLTSKNGDLIHAVFLHGDYEDQAKEYRQKIKEKNPSFEAALMEDTYKPHVSVSRDTWNELKNSGAKTASEAGIEFGDAEIHHGPEKKHVYERIQKSEFEALEKASYVKAKPDHPFKVGDRVKHNDGTTGKVTEIASRKISVGNPKEGNFKFVHHVKVQRDSNLSDSKLGHGGRGDIWDHADSYKKETDLQKSESFDKQTLLNRLAQETEKRKLPCGQIGFLLHRGMDNQEHKDKHVGGKSKYQKQTLEWSPKYKDAKEDAEKVDGKVVSAWIPEKSVIKSNGDKIVVNSEDFYHAHPEIVKKNMF